MSKARPPHKSAGYASRLKWVEKQIHACRSVALRYFRSKHLKIKRKADRSPVTAADHAIEARLRKAIEKQFPGERIIGEEFGDSRASLNDYWTIDPIDGTRAFSRGLPTWGIMVGRVEQGRAVLGVCDYPALGITLAAAQEVRAYERNLKRKIYLPTQAPPVRSLSEATLLHGGSAWWQPCTYYAGFQRVVAGCFLERAWGDCYGYLWLFRGLADAVLEHGVKVWDVVPLAAIAQATGRVVLDAEGKPTLTGPTTVFAHESFARRISRMLRTR